MRLLTAVSGVRVPQQAPSSPQGELRNNSPFLGELFACMPAAPLRVAKMQDVRCAPRYCGTIAPLSHFCSAGRLRRGFFFLLVFFLSLEPPDAVFALHDSRVQISWRKLAIPSLRSLRGFESLRGPRRKNFRWGLFQAPSSPQGELRNNSPFLGELFACMPAAPLRVAKMQDVRCAPRYCGTIAPLSHFCSAGRLRRGFFFLLVFFLSLEPRALNLRSLGGFVVLKLV